MRHIAPCRVALARRSWAALLLVAGACTIDEPKPTYDLGTFPYHPLVHELDLAIFAYQLHAQSMVWPIDPYYEEEAGDRGTPRDTLMARVRTWAAQLAQPDALAAYRGPGIVEGLPDNATHDPILYDYARIHPWSDAISNNEDAWTEYRTPSAITRRIRDVYVSARAIGDADAIAVTPVPAGRADAAPDASDLLCAFEGGTGDKGILDAPASYSLMGFALARDTGNGGYDVHVAFRGSRSGSAWRAVTEAFSEGQAAGNPDWITDLAWDKVALSTISTTGGVDRGFGHAMEYALPTVIPCLQTIARARGGLPPASIYVTGHSLGAALATQFASAILLGDTYGPDGEGVAMPAELGSWPWRALKLVTYSAPRAGDYTWATALSKGALDSAFYDPGPAEAADADARLVLDPGIVDRLNDPDRPAAFRVLISTDPISTTKIGGDGVHVGTTVYVNGTSILDWIGLASVDDHEPMNVRADMLAQLADPSIPDVAWDYLPVAALVPDRDPAAAGTPAEIQKLADGLVAYYADRGLYFDAAAFRRDVELRFAIERGTAPAHSPAANR